MSQLLLLIPLLLTLALSFAGAEAQPVPTWRNDAQGRPAPPCMTLDQSTGLSTPCPSTGGAGSSGASTTLVGRTRPFPA